jgi:hypothetical protein
MMSGKIFISYRRDDSAAVAVGIGQYLAREFGRRNVFIDVDIGAGAKFPAVLEHRLAKCKVLLAVIGPSWLDARDNAGNRRLDDPKDWVRLEIVRALKRGITVIPVLIGGAKLPNKADLPEDLQRLLDHQYALVTTNGFRNEMGGLARDIREIPNDWSWRRLAVGAVVLMVLMLVGWIAGGGLVWNLSLSAGSKDEGPGGGVVTGPVSGGQVANTINNFYGTMPSKSSGKPFAEDAVTPVTFSIGCMNFRPINELLNSINSGRPTAFLSAQRLREPEPTPLVSLYMKDGAIWADISLFAPQQKYVAFSLRGNSFRKLAPNWDVNASSHSIEVVNENGVPIFQLMRSSSSHLRIDGLFRADDRILLLGHGGTFVMVLRDDQARTFSPPADFLPKLFRYPSREYPGEMVNPEPPRPSCPTASQSIFAIGQGLIVPL